ncbi:MAG: rhodanese-like domain-containing protein [Candidatus Electrothrix scaldis]|nr:MAG: rhodanese-like domain-containing protein [Candidatus Electrothrix sp. GW3-3]
MRWKQFLTPVKSLNAPETKEYLKKYSLDEYNLIDVRQPSEYRSGHIPGAKLIPVAEMTERSKEIDPTKPTIVYCAIGGRSRVAAQMLAGKGFSKVINMAGGFKAWNDDTAFGAEETGMTLFSGKEKLEDVLLTAYSLEAGLEDFYTSLQGRVKQEEVKSLFNKLSSIEVKHQERIYAQYQQISSAPPLGREEFASKAEKQAMEGGLSTEEYLAQYPTDFENITDVVSLAMGIEAQALDLYLRAADNSTLTDTRQALLRIAEEERTHLKLLGDLLDQQGDNV